MQKLRTELSLYQADSYNKEINNIKINCLITQENLLLKLLFIIEIPKNLQQKISWYSFSSENITFHDYLWDDTCLECFLGKQGEKQYIEINASPTGYYAVYQFNDYRTPSSLPPTHLQTTQEQGRITWLKHSQKYERQFSFDLNQLPPNLAEFDLINPCVILYLENKPLFYANKHAEPADFHQQQYWLSC
ncbi:MAG: hypothetical protein KGV51_04180 [Moraxellaceae bacterium]|nr:hypothetical protein [Moraxellaceae bacterium]